MKPKQKVILYTGPERPHKYNSKMSYHDKYRAKLNGDFVICPECGRKMKPPAGKTQPHRMKAPNQFMNCPGVPE